MANLQQLPQDLQTKLQNAGVDPQKLLNAPAPAGVDAADWKKWITAIIQIIVAIFGNNPPKTAANTNHANELKNVANACPCPGGSDGHACCHAAQTYILLAALCCEGHCCKGQSCDTKCCCQETAHYLLCALECCTTHCSE